MKKKEIKKKSLLFACLLTICLVSSIMVLQFNLTENPVEPKVSGADPGNVAFTFGTVVVEEYSSYFVVSNGKFVLEVYKDTAGYDVLRNNDGEVLIYDLRWTLEYQQNKNNWKQIGNPQSVTVKRVSQSEVDVVRSYDNFLGLTYTVTSTVRHGEAIKITFDLQTDLASREYRLVWGSSGITYNDFSPEGYGYRFKNSDASKDVFLDWTDAFVQHGSIASTEVSSVAQGRKADITFNIGTIGASSTYNLDPTIDTTDETNSVGLPCQRQMFYAQSRWWIAYVDGNQFNYTTSTDGYNWASPLTIDSCTDDFDISLATNTTHIAYAHAVGVDDEVDFRLGALQTDGTITWDAAESAVVCNSGSGTALFPSIEFDSSGLVYVVYTLDSGGNRTPYVIKNDWTNGSWSTTSGYPQQLDSTADNSHSASIVRLTSGKMFAAWGNDASTLQGSYYNGSGWEALDSATSNMEDGHHFSLAPEGDNIHCVFLEDVNYDINYVLYNTTAGDFGTEVTLQDSPQDSESVPVVGYDSLLDDTIVFWGNETDDKIYYIKHDGSSWGSVTEFMDESTNTLEDADSVTCSVEEFGYKVGMMYVTGSGSPWNVVFVEFSEGNDYLMTHLSIDDGRLDVDGTVRVWVNATYSSDGTAFNNTGSNSLSINGTDATFSSGNGWYADFTQSSVGQQNYVVLAFQDNVRGVTEVGEVFFDGDDCSYDFGDICDVGTGDFTIEALVEIHGQGASGDILSKGHYDGALPNVGWRLRFNSNNKFDAGCQDSDTAEQQELSDSSYSDGDIVHVVAVFDRDDVLTMYCDGSAQTSPTDITSNNGNLDNNRDLYIGSYNMDSTYAEFNGTIFHVRLWNRTLDANEAYSLYQGQSPNSTGLMFNIDSSTYDANDNQWTDNVASVVGAVDGAVVIQASTLNDQVCRPIFDGLSMTSIQSPSFLDNGDFSYLVKITYAYDSSAIDSGVVRVVHTNGTELSSGFTANSTGWATVVLGQTNSSSAGTYTLIGHSDVDYGITDMYANQTFLLDSWTLQARDASGTNLPRSVVFDVDVGSSAFDDFTSSTAGLSDTIYAPNATTYTITTKWGSHTTQSSTVTLSANTATNIDTKIRRIDDNTNYALISLANTALVSPTLQGEADILMHDATPSGSLEIKYDLANWKTQEEPQRFEAGTHSFERGDGTWSYSSNIFTLTNDYTDPTSDILLVFPSASGGGSPGGGSSGGGTTTPTNPTTTSDPNWIIPLTPSDPTTATVQGVPIAGYIVLICVVVLVGIILYATLTKRDPWSVLQKEAKKVKDVKF